MWQQISEGGSTDASPPEVPSLWLLELTALAQVVDDKKKKKKKEIQSNNNKLPAASHSLCFTCPQPSLSEPQPP